MLVFLVSIYFTQRHIKISVVIAMIVSARMSIMVTVSVADNDFVPDPIATYIQYVHKDKESNKRILIATYYWLFS